MNKGILALTKDGKLTYCTALAELRGQGRCNHVDHIRDGETVEEFNKRIEINRNKLVKTSDYAAKAVYRQQKKQFELNKKPSEYFEDEIVERFKISCHKLNSGIDFKYASNEENALEGTDLHLGEVRADITLNGEKDNTNFTESLDLGFTKIKFGIRTRNKAAKFEENTVIIHFNAIFTNSREVDGFVNLFNDEDIVKIAEGAIDAYYNDADKEDEEVSFEEWWDRLDDIEREDYNRSMEEFEDGEDE